MNLSEFLNIRILPYEISNALYSKIKSNAFHLSYKDEIRLFSCVKNGDLEKLFNEIKLLDTITVGQMSSDDLQQYKYMAVSCITLATRYAVEGGLDENDAYTFSDLFIRKIDTLKSTQQITKEIAESVIKLTNSVCDEKKKLKHSPHIRKCISHINRNLNKKITVKDLAEECNLSQDYLSQLFKKEMNENLSAYIMKRKLEAAKLLLLDGVDNSRIAYALGFSSQSHFISSFKREYALTPKEFASLYK